MMPVSLESIAAAESTAAATFPRPLSVAHRASRRHTAKTIKAESISALPATFATASTCTGWLAKMAPAKVLTLAGAPQDCSTSTARPEIVACSNMLTTWYGSRRRGSPQSRCCTRKVKIVSGR
eukprot:scaffold537_cov241-Pinguiococcus_pyrenoidosus.AAC.17